MKKLLALLLAVVMVFAMAACSKDTPDTSDKTPAVSDNAPSTPDATPETPDATPETPAEPVEVNVAYMANWGALWAVATADAKGYFEEEGLTVVMTPFQDGPTEIAAMEQGSIDISYIGPGAHKLCAQGKAEVVLLQHLGDGDCIIGLNGVTKLEDLRGKKVAYAAGTSSETILTTALASVGMTMDDIEAMNMNASNMVSAAVGGTVDAVAAWSPSSLKILKEVEGSVDMCSNVDFDGLASPGSWVVNPAWADENEETIVKFLRAMYKGMDYAAAATTDDAVASEVAGYIAAIIASDEATVLEQRYDGSWMTSAQMQEMLNNGGMVKVYADQRANFISSGAITEEQATHTAEQFILTDLMNQAFGE